MAPQTGREDNRLADRDTISDTLVCFFKGLSRANDLDVAQQARPLHSDEAKLPPNCR
jgi:hypothetical protein